MNKVKYAVIIMLIVIAFCIWALYYLHSCSEYFGDIIIQIMDNAVDDNYQKASELSELLAIEWTKKEKILSIVANNKELDEITFIIYELESYADQEHISELRASCEKITTILAHIWQFQKLSLYNLI